MTFEEKKERIRTALDNGGFMALEFWNEGTYIVVKEANGKLFRPIFAADEILKVLNGYTIDTKGRCVHNHCYRVKK